MSLEAFASSPTGPVTPGPATPDWTTRGPVMPGSAASGSLIPGSAMSSWAACASTMPGWPGSDPTQPGQREPSRINVAVAPETVHALRGVIEREGVSLTEAVRRLVGYGDFLYRTAKEDRTELLVREGSSTSRVTLR